MPRSRARRPRMLPKEAALLLALVLWSGSCTRRPSACEDHLHVEAGPFGRYGSTVEYEDALARILLPTAYRQIEMVWVPSFSEEGSVYVEKVSDRPVEYRVTAMTMKKHLFADMYARLEARKEPNGRIPFGRDDQRRAIEEAAPVASRIDAPISERAANALQSLWRAALLDARHPSGDELAVTDATAFHFADWTSGVGYRTGVAWNPTGSRIQALVAVGDGLAEYARADPARRPALEAQLVRQANALRDRFLNRAGCANR